MAIQIDLSGHVALVTGAGGQLGRCIARTLARCGADVAVHYLTSRAMAEKVLADVRAAAFLASDLAKFISGVYLPVCGGNVMPCI